MSTRDRRVMRWLLLSLVFVFGGLYAATYLYTAERLPAGTTVSDIKVGGLTPEAAELKLTQGLGGRAAEPLVVSGNGERTVVRPTAAGLGFDVPETVDRAMPDPSWDPRRLWDHFAGGTDVDAVVTVESAALADTVGDFAEQVDQHPVDGIVTFHGGTATARYPERGTVLDQAAAADAIRAAFLRDNGPEDVVQLPTREARSMVTKTAVSRAMDEFANPAVSGPVTVRLAGRSVRLQPEDFAGALSVEAVGSELRPQLDRNALLRLLRPHLKRVTRAPRDATVAIVDGRPHVVPARDGLTFDPDEVTDAFLPVLRNEDDARTMSVRGVPARPAVTTADVRKLGITEKVSAFTTRFPYAAYRNVNLGRAARLVDGTVLEPGETFSLNETVGQRTAENGFTEGFIISDGVFREDFGGGVSQVASTLYNAAFFAGLEDVEHKAHSFYISRYPIGREATVVWPDVDLKFKNTTPYGVLIRASIDRATPSRKGTMRVAMWSTKHWDIKTTKSAPYDRTPHSTRRLSGPDCVPNQGYAGFDIDVYRLFYPHGSTTLARRERIHTTYTPADTVICP